jgi:peptide deformylase
MVLKILKYPHPALTTPCPIEERFDETLQALVQDMVEAMYDCTGAVGLAANQVGAIRRVFVMDMTAKTTRDQLKILVNPEILQQSRNRTSREGCLSFPEYLANVKRAQKVIVRCFDASGNLQQWEAEQLEAVCIQHEIDHLDGVLMLDRIESLKTDWVRRRVGPPLDEALDTPESEKTRQNELCSSQTVVKGS